MAWSLRQRREFFRHLENLVVVINGLRRGRRKRRVMARYVDLVSAFFAIAAAFFWFLSAYGKLPPMRPYWDSTPKDDPFHSAVRFSARMNATAAVLSGLSAFCMGIGLFMRG